MRPAPDALTSGGYGVNGQTGGFSMRHRRWFVLVVAGLALVSAGCISLDPPPGAPPLRYRDELFSNIAVTSDIPYGLAPDFQGQVIALWLDVYRPTGDTVTQRPAIVWVHGGGFSGGNKGSGEIVDQARAFARKGYVSVSISYRLRPTGCLNNPPPGSCFGAMTDAQHDAQAAVRFLRKNRTTYGIDPNRIGISGSSAGAVTAMNVAFNPNDPGTSGTPGFSSAVQGAGSLSGGRTLGSAGAGDAPTMLFHGTGDGVVPYALGEGHLRPGEGSRTRVVPRELAGRGACALRAVPRRDHHQADELLLRRARPRTRGSLKVFRDTAQGAFVAIVGVAKRKRRLRVRVERQGAGDAGGGRQLPLLIVGATSRCPSRVGLRWSRLPTPSRRRAIATSRLTPTPTPVATAQPTARFQGTRRSARSSGGGSSPTRPHTPASAPSRHEGGQRTGAVAHDHPAQPLRRRHALSLPLRGARYPPPASSSAAAEP